MVVPIAVEKGGMVWSVDDSGRVSKPLDIAEVGVVDAMAHSSTIDDLNHSLLLWGGLYYRKRVGKILNDQIGLEL